MNDEKLLELIELILDEERYNLNADEPLGFTAMVNRIDDIIIKAVNNNENT